MITLAPGALAHCGALARAAGVAPGPCALVSDTRVFRLHGAAVVRALARAGFRVRAQVLVPPGERSKSLDRARALYTAFARAGLDRSNAVFALGGGVVGDLAGFAAATWLRGVPLVILPTTVLAQVDSSVGGKVGVDLPEGKNLVGAFHQPRAVVIDPRVLRTLPARHVRAGLVEAVKVGLVLDAALFRLIEAHAGDLIAGGPAGERAMLEVIARAVGAKARVVSRDERDGGERQLLNYGHTVGHALEALGGYRRFLHGEAVAVGMDVAARIAVRRGMLDPRVAARQGDVLRALGLPLPARALAGVSARKVFHFMQLDKKRAAGETRFVLTGGVGVASFGQPVTRSQVIAALQDAGCEP
jgi:3-dehydroquinate synthase